MSLTVFIKVENKETYEVELGSHDTVKDLYRKAGEAAGVEVGTFLLRFEGEELDETLGGNEIQHLGMWEGCELLLCCNVRNTMCVLSRELSSEETRKAIEQRLEEDPDLLLQVEASDVFLELCEMDLPFELRHLKVTDPGKRVTAIGEGFLEGCESLVTLDLISLQSVWGIESKFLYGCKSLQTVDLTPFRNITRVTFACLAYCESLTQVDLGPLQNVTDLEFGFMESCKSLQTLDVSPLRNVRVIGGWFLSCCSSLTSVDLSPLRNLTVVGDSFLSDCSSLTSVDLGLCDVVSVGDYFLRGCGSLTSVDLRPMQDLRSMGRSFLSDCSSLTTVDFGHLRERVADVGEGFMHNCNEIPIEERRPPSRVRCTVC